MARPFKTRQSRRSVRTFRPQLQRLEDRLAMAEGATFVDDSWQSLFDVDFSFSLTPGDVVTNGTVAGAYGVTCFGRVTSGPVQGSLPGMTTINDAIANTNTGGTVLLQAGTYQERVAITKSLTLLGNAPSGLASDVVIDSPSASCIAVDSTAANVLIRNLRVTGAGAGIHSRTAASLTLQNVRADGNYYGIVLNGISGLAYLSSVVADNNQIGSLINTRGSATVDGFSSFSGNHGTDIGSAGLAINVDGPVRLTDVTASGNASGGIELSNLGSDATLVRVTADNNDANNDGVGDGLAAVTYAGALKAIAGNLLIQGSRFRDTGGANDHQERGIYIKSITGSVTFEDSPGPSPQSMEVSDNEGGGVVIADGGTTATFTKGRYSGNGGTGLQIVSAQDVSLSLLRCDTNDADGISLQNVNDVVVDSTTADFNAGTGLYIAGAGKVTISDSNENGSAFSHNGSDGINVASTASVSIGDYTEASDNGGIGINLGTISAAVTVTNVTAKRNDGSGLAVSNAVSVNISGSTFAEGDNVQLVNVSSLGWGAGNSVDVDPEIHIVSSTSLNSGLPIVIDGATAETQYTQLEIHGSINLNNVPLVLDGDYIPTPGETFTILSASASVAGQFQNLPNGSVISFNGKPLQMIYTGHAVTLTALPPGFYAVNDQFTVVAGTPQALNVLGNDFIDKNGGIVVESRTIQPSGPTQTTNADGTVTFSSATPGDYTFLYDTSFKQHKLLASDGAAGDALGNDVAIDGDTMIVGARLDDGTKGTDQGAAYVYVRSGTGWIQQAKLVASDGAKGDFFGASVAISGNTVVIGASSDDLTGGTNQGSAYVFVRTGTTWKQQAKLTATNAGASDAGAGDAFGTSVAITGDWVVVGAPLDDGSAGADQGSAYFFQRNGVNWGTSQKVTPTDSAAGSRFGWDVDIDGTNIVVGADGANAGQGSAYVFELGFVWGQVAKLTASDGAAGDAFGRSVAISGDRIVVGAELHDGPFGVDAGKAYFYARSGLNWTLEDALDGGAGDLVGGSVAISGDRIVVGAARRDVDGRVDQGWAYVILRLPEYWIIEKFLTAAGGAAQDNLGTVAISGTTVVVGAPGADVSKGVNRGAVYVQDVRSTGATVSVKVVAHQLAASTQTAVPGLPVTFTSTFAPGVVGTVTFKEGTKVLGTAPVGTSGKASLAVAFETYGNHTVSATFGNGVPVTTSVNVVQAAMLPDPLDPTRSSLFVGGTAAADTIIVEPTGVEYLRVTVKSAKLGTIPAATYTGVFTNGVERIVVYGGKQNDNITIQVGLTQSAWVYGQDGNDTITGGGGNDLLFGGAGDDKLGGALGRDILIGGAGKDSLNAGSGGSLLLPGPSTLETNHDAALLYIQSEWASDHDLATRANNLRGDVLYSTGTSATVQSDTSADTLNGSAAADWFFANRTGSGTKDKIVGLTAIDLADEL